MTRTRQVAIAVAIAGLIAGTYLVLVERAKHAPVAFESGAWRRGSPTERGRMVQDLLHKGLVVGKNAQDVEALLGKPDSDQKDHGGTRRWAYTVDIGQKFVTTSWKYSVTLTFGEDGLVTKQMFHD